MAISNGEKEQKKAIINRIQQILDNAKNIDNLSMIISAPRAEVPTIKYSVTEFIFAEDAENEQTDRC